MSIINHFLSVVIEPQFKLARDLTAMAIADGKVTPEEKEAIRAICQLENINEATLMESLQGNYENADVRIPKERKEKESYLRLGRVDASITILSLYRSLDIFQQIDASFKADAEAHCRVEDRHLCTLFGGE